MGSEKEHIRKLLMVTLTKDEKNGEKAMKTALVTGGSFRHRTQYGRGTEKCWVCSL